MINWHVRRNAMSGISVSRSALEDRQLINPTQLHTWMSALDALPYELWTSCIAFAVDGKEAGPLPLLLVSKRWERLLFETPALWTQIHIQNGEDELARICTFLHFSKECPLHLEIMTPLPNMDYLQPVAMHISRVATISIRPGLSDRDTPLHMEQWKRVASPILAKLSNGILPPDVKDTSCSGVSLRHDNQLYYCVLLMQFEMAQTIASIDKPDSNTIIEPLEAAWEVHVERCVFAAHWQSNLSVLNTSKVLSA